MGMVLSVVIGVSPTWGVFGGMKGGLPIPDFAKMRTSTYAASHADA